MASFPAEMHGAKDTLENIIWSILLVPCVRLARYDSAVPSTMGQNPTNHCTSASLARGDEKDTAFRRLRTRINWMTASCLVELRESSTEVIIEKSEECRRMK